MIDAALALIVLALGAGAFVKGATGMGLPIVALPILATSLGLTRAIVTLLVPILATNVWQMWRLRGEAKAGALGFLWPMLLGGVAGIGLGTVALGRVDDALLTRLLGLLLVVFVLFRLFGPKGAALPAGIARRLAAPAGFLAGVLQGSMGIAAPFAVPFIQSMSLAPRSQIFAVSAIFLLFAVVQALVLLGAGLMEARWIGEGVLALLPVALGLLAGQAVGERIGQAAFNTLILALLAVLGVKMSLGV